ncbi:hypothetical protein [Streptomyces sp. SID3343]|uniref:hypothetical protein n=1 Tax=Streptomyces sp. SID3343 TaxID=2690260 RepID=UPI00136C777E|nr:hypothetical protein [Streptomyces sp. SID3343]MYW00198.1 hypothetical protein [Streptomyces sp. SID3343]
MTAAETEAPIAPPVWFKLPDAFTQIPLDDDLEVRADRVGELVMGDVESITSYEEAESLVKAMAFWGAMSEVLDEQGAMIAAILAVPRDTGDEVDVISFALTFTQVTPAPPEVAIPGLLTTVEREKPDADVRAMTLPCGEAVAAVAIGDLRLPVPEPEPGRPDTLDMFMGHIQVLIPVPNEPWLAVFDMTSTAQESWPECSELMAGIMRSVSFTEPDGSDPDVLPAAPAWEPDYGPTYPSKS